MLKGGTLAQCAQKIFQNSNFFKKKYEFSLQCYIHFTKEFFMKKIVFTLVALAGLLSASEYVNI